MRVEVLILTLPYSLFCQLIWKNTTEIGAAWTLLQDKRLAIFIKYYPEGNIAGNFGRNVFRPTARKLGSEWGRVPPEFTWCPADAVQGKISKTKPPVKAAVTKLLFNVQLFIWALPLALLTVVIFL